MAEIKLIALDMDGTLLNSDEEVSEYTKETIAKALEKNVRVVLSTGRWLGSCYPYAEALNLKSDLITCNGGEIWTINKELVERHLFDEEKMNAMYEIARTLGMFTWMVATDRIFYDEKPDDLSSYAWLKFGCATTDKKVLDEFIEQISYFEGLELTNSMPLNVEINPKGVNKANALRRVCRDLGLTMDQVMAAGDSLNDIKMIQEAGVGVAMGNAQEAIKKAADYITDTNDNDGVAKAIEKFVL
ncbi:MAG TPA: Cof-type HAD-IIB family hydrolase [Bacillota bacterium]|nr:Cof-type HAD-IIB family hydrolase [Bacillota bacterium]